MGRNAASRLKDGGIALKKGDALFVPAADIWAPPKGHPLFHPRFGDPIDREMADDIKERGVEKPIKVREDPLPDGARRLLLVDGGRRTRNALAAQGEIGETVYVPIELFSGTDAEVLLERIRANADPLKKADKASVLALTVAQIKRLGPLDVRAVAAVMPKGIGPAEVEALARWNDLGADARRRFDDGAPIGLLAAVLEAPRDEQVARLDKLIAAGVKSARGATRRTNAERDERDPWARRMSPKQAHAVAAALANMVTVPGQNGPDPSSELARGLSIGVQLASYGGSYIPLSTHPRALLERLPKPIADAIREARAAKRKAATK